MLYVNKNASIQRNIYLVTDFLMREVPWVRLCDPGDDPQWGPDPDLEAAAQVPGVRRDRDLR